MSNKTVDNKIDKVLLESKQSLDEIHQHMFDIITINRLTNSEVASLFTSLMKQILTTETNSKLLSKLGIEVGMLTPKTIAAIQEALTVEWLEQNGLLK